MLTLIEELNYLMLLNNIKTFNNTLYKFRTIKQYNVQLLDQSHL